LPRTSEERDDDGRCDDRAQQPHRGDLRRLRSAFGIKANMVYSPITDTGLVTDALITQT
jgi:hypothetical protein